jgi:CubicO group peptidase (beta-lactamase class C family)
MENALLEKLKDFDRDMERLLKDWNAPGVGLGIVANDKLVFAKGYGYRDYEKQLPFTPSTLCPIASNTKLFTSVAAGLLVAEGKLTWDRPIRDAVPSIRFYSDALNNTVTLRDMLAHRTGITGHDTIWYESDFARKELFERLKYLAPKEPLRQTHLYNNLMYAAVGYLIELQTGRTWEEFVHERILNPLDMHSTVYTIAEMLKQPDYAVPFSERRDTTEIYRVPYYEDSGGAAPAGNIITNIQDMSHWLMALMNEGTYLSRQVLPQPVLKETLEPAITLPKGLGGAKGFRELINIGYGMGRRIHTYRGHLLSRHGGEISSFYSQISYLPHDHIGVIVFVIGDHCGILRDIISYAVYERLLGMDRTPWSERWLEVTQQEKKAGTAARSKANVGRVPNTHPSHSLRDYTGDYEHPAYGRLKIGLTGDQLQFAFHKLKFPLTHFHYDRFDTPDDECHGKWSVNFLTNPQGEVDKAVMSLDQADVQFIRIPEPLAPERLQQLAGTYETAGRFKFQVVLRQRDNLYIVFPGDPDEKLIHYKGLQFRTEKHSDVVYEFVEEHGEINALKQRDSAGEYVFPRK